MKRYQSINIKDVLGSKKSVSSRFHRKTSIDILTQSTIPYEKWPIKWKKIHYKEYPRFESIDLRFNCFTGKGEFEKAITERRSQRDFNKNKTVNLKELGKILNLSAGINKMNKDAGLLLRSWPSAGARYPLDCYILNNNVKGLENNFSYHYNVKRNSLEKLFAIQNAEKFFVKLTGQKWTESASFIVAIAATFGRTTIKYGDRGYRYCLLDAGHLAQNIALTSTYLELKNCPIGGFSDLQINNFLDFDGVGEAVIYLIAIGK